MIIWLKKTSIFPQKLL